MGSGGDADRLLAKDLLRRPEIGLLDQHFQYRDALDAGKTSFGSAKNQDS